MLGGVVVAVLIIVLVAAAGGAAVALQAQLVGLINSRLGTVEAIFVTYGLGGLLAAALLAVVRGGSISAWRGLPAYVYLAGAFGLVIIGAISFSVARLGVVRGLLLVTAAQFVVAALVDQFGWFGATMQPVTLQKVVGVALLVAGGWLVLR